MAIFDVSQFGGDVQKAIKAAAVDGGGTVYLPRGEYQLTHALSITTPLTLRGDGPWSSTLKMSNVDEGIPGILVGGKADQLSGVVLDGFGIVATKPKRYGSGIIIENCWGTSLSNIKIDHAPVGLTADSCGPLDVTSLYVSGARECGLYIRNCGSDLFFSKIHVNNGTPSQPPGKIDWSKPANWPNPEAIGLNLFNVSGAHFTDCDFVGGLLGVFVDAEDDVNNDSDWLKFVSVSCDTVLQDPWHIVRAQGLHMTNCWSGTFLNGTGIWIGEHVMQMSIVNHQWRNGLYGVGNDKSPSVLVLGGIMGGIASKNQFPVSKPGHTTWRYILGADIQKPKPRRKKGTSSGRKSPGEKGDIGHRE